MSVHEFKPKSQETLSYSPTYLENLIETYKRNQASLNALAHRRPLWTKKEFSSEALEEQRLMENQHHLLELVALVQPTNVKDVHQIMKLWHQVAIQEVAPKDISPSDKLALVAHRYIEQLA